ncbi:unnamed protein product [Ilex paraguariensis]|uniref:F-box domain-containing protein n=1 Tax=Ilex paraguariensis TaxID=185542 RepID=A0ABC8TCH0_9AQUA
MSGNGENGNLPKKKKGENGCGGVVDFFVLPEGCIANALSLMSPRDVCRLSLVASIFRSAAESDAVWERFLPSDYEVIVARSVDRSALTFESKKELYLHLCDHPVIIEGGTKKLSTLRVAIKGFHAWATRAAGALRSKKLRGRERKRAIERLCSEWVGDGLKKSKLIYERSNGIKPLEVAVAVTGRQSFSLQKWSGKRCYMLAPRHLSIVWGNTPRYWRWTSLPESRFSEVAELIVVCWLEIRGKINTSMLYPNTTYAAYLVFKLTAGAHGFEYQPVEVSVGINGGGGETRTVYLDPDGGRRQIYEIIPRRIGLFNHQLASLLRQLGTVPRENRGQYSKLRGDGWMEIELGQYVNNGGQDGELEMSLMEVKGGNAKGGLIIQGLEIRPKDG